MKRLNPITCEPFRRGDIRHDGKIFHAYKKRLKSDGFFAELWYSPETQKINKEQARTQTQEKRLNAHRGGDLIRRLNPATNKQFIIGEQDENGRYFICYHNYSYNKKYFHEQWASPARWHRLHIAATVSSARKRAKLNGIPFSIDIDYAMSLYPENGCCPALGFRMYWGSKHDRSSSPSLDRLIPELGYVKGNLTWISARANVIKNDSTIEELQLVLNWFKDAIKNNSQYIYNEKRLKDKI